MTAFSAHTHAHRHTHAHTHTHTHRFTLLSLLEYCIELPLNISFSDVTKTNAHKHTNTRKYKHTYTHPQLGEAQMCITAGQHLTQLLLSRSLIGRPVQT